MVLSAGRPQKGRTMDYYENGELMMTDTFTHQCPDCEKTVRVVGGKARWHWCRMPRRFREARGAAWAEGERWVMDHPGDYGLRPMGADSRREHDALWQVVCDLNAAVDVTDEHRVRVALMHAREGLGMEVPHE